MSSAEHGTHVRMDTAATMVDDGDYFINEPNVSPSSSKRKEEPALMSPLSPTVVQDIDGVVASDKTPPNDQCRRLVVCYDGTGDRFDKDNSNIVEFVGLLRKDDPSKQMVYYHSGIGTFTSPEYSNWGFSSNVSKLLDEAFAWNLKTHITDGYEFLMQNYRPHCSDKICIFGFSRGAYTARCLAGMLEKVGLLPAFNNQQIPFAYEMYTDDASHGWKQSSKFKHKFGNEVVIEFMGLWETVNSVGLTPRRLPFTHYNTAVKTFRHAVALDEHRVKFKPVHWPAPNQSRPKMGTMRDSERIYVEDEERKEGKRGGPNIEEVWFAGCHCDIGGGSVKNSVKISLARIPLRWMIRECFKMHSGLLFHLDQLKSVNLDPTTLDPTVLRRPEALPLITLPPEDMYIKSMKSEERVAGPFARFFARFKKVPVKGSHSGDVDSEELADLKDSLAPIYDELKLNPFWWIVECIHHGVGRKIPMYQGNDGDFERVHVHRSVKTRMEAANGNGHQYSPGVINFEEERVVWVD